MKVFSSLFLLIKQLSFFGIYILSFLFPRNKKLWLYGNFKGTFRDNSKYLFLYGNETLPEIVHVWISPSKEVVAKLSGLGYRAVYKYSFSAFLYALRAKVYIYNIYATTDIYNGCFRGSAFLFNCWHGVPYKKIEYDVKTGPLQSYYNPQRFRQAFYSFLREPKTFRLSSAVIATSQKLVNIFSKAFLIDEKNVFVGQYPRNEVFKWDKAKLIDHVYKVESDEVANIVSGIKKFKYVMIYMPTWRDDNANFINEAIPDFDLLEDICRTNNILFLIKSHILTSFAVDFSRYRCVRTMDSNADVYPLLPFTNALISDYSSIIFDYSLLNKKIFFYPYDKEDYLSKCREAYFSYEDIFTTKAAMNFGELCKEIVEFVEENRSSKKQYHYPSVRGLVDSNNGMKEMVNFIKRSINY
jgi:CDP-glycerol glycerophosphotransferase (TagB/SpsB family)